VQAVGSSADAPIAIVCVAITANKIFLSGVFSCAAAGFNRSLNRVMFCIRLDNKIKLFEQSIAMQLKQ
jgi:hypothetical protein